MISTREIAQAEVLDENGRPVYGPSRPKDAARPKGDTGGLVGGFFVLAFGFVVTLFVAAFSVFILLPLLLLGRILGFEVKRFRG